MSDQHIVRLTNDPTAGVCENEFAIANVWIIDTYVAGDFNGNFINISKYYSDVSGSQATINLSAIGSISVSYCNFQDIAIVGGTVTASNSIDSGNNSGIVFLSTSGGGETVINTIMNGVPVSIVKMYIDGMTYICYVNGTNLMMDRKYFDSSDNIIGTSATIL